MAKKDTTIERDQAVWAGRLRLRLQDDVRQGRLTPASMDDLRGRLDGRRETHLVTIEGVPDSFCAGLDLDELVQQGEASTRRHGITAAIARYAALLTTIERLPCPVVALVDGPALGGGLGLASVADLVLATNRATFALPETLMGVIPAMAFPPVARRIGVPRARLLALGAPTLTAPVAREWGLVDEVVDNLEGALARHARRWSHMDRRAMGALKALVATHFTAPAGYQAEAVARFGDLMMSRETHMRLARFARGGAPWQGEDPS